MNNRRVLSFSELKSVKGIGFSRQHINRLISAGKFPRPLKLGEASNAWLENEIDAWISEKAAERDQQVA